MTWKIRFSNLKMMKDSDLPPSDFHIYTDGSGNYTELLGISAAIVFYVPTGQHVVKVHMSNDGDTRRAEMQALLNGLRVVWHHCNLDEGEVLDEIRRNQRPRPHVLWYTDRQEIARAITAPPGAKLFKRRNMQDMWAALASFETWIRITANWVPRNTVRAQAACDHVCTILRQETKAMLLKVKAGHGIDLL